jgi:hypothetical protein
MSWETKFSIQLALFGLSLVLAIPLGMNLFGTELMGHVPSFNELMEDHLFCEITGYAGLAIALLQVVFSARKRLEWNFPGPSFPAWRGFHILAGVAFLLIVVIHTGGRLGWNLNGWLQSAFILTVFIGLIGKVWETRLLARASSCATSPRHPPPCGRGSSCKTANASGGHRWGARLSSSQQS